MFYGDEYFWINVFINILNHFLCLIHFFASKKIRLSIFISIVIIFLKAMLMVPGKNQIKK